MIYLDNSATTQPSKVCVDTMTELLTCAWGNPSSVHALGIDAEKRLKAARAQVAQALGAEPERVFSPPAAPRLTTGPFPARLSVSASADVTSSRPPSSTTPSSIRCSGSRRAASR